MTAYQVAPGLTPEEYDALRADIAAHGIRVPVDVDENGQILDGHHRSLIAAELQVECPRRVLADLTEDAKVAHAIAVNVHRRSLTREQKRDMLAASIKSAPEVADREHARRVGVHHETAGAVRAQLIESGDVAETATRTDSLGRQQPSRPVKVETTVKETTYVDPDTGEVLTPTTPVLTAEQWAAQNDVAAFVSDDSTVNRARLVSNYARLIVQAGEGLPLLDVHALSGALDATHYAQADRLRRAGRVGGPCRAVEG